MSNGVPSFDALMPKDMAVKAENVGIAKAGLGAYKMFALAILAGAFIAMGANYATTVWSGLAAAGVPYGLQRLAGGLVFATGLIMVVIGGSELFTGNCLIPMAWANNKVTTGAMLRNWVIVYCGNFIGSVLTAYMVFLGGQHKMGAGAVGLSALGIGVAKTSLDFIPCICLAIFCNALVCMAVWMCFGARSSGDKVLVILPPISAFVACGFEHCVANMYFIPSALFIKDFDPVYFATVAEKLKDGGAILTWGNFISRNLIPATIGNIIGGALMVGLMYWFIFLRPSWTGKKAESGAQPTVK
ncbi:MAG: formate/nitrite transporter family protein [Desulfobacteraceae bacterium]|nr:formate/nitrite transporter family protein [Desulfobacteraceae bacterium]